ncbi:C4-dicarboxylate transport transcriptional regulatory protein DctD [Rhodocyclaceae bacterium]|nr:C4-dicarboxylate transport transcriptional regulatory protein DctD [Rhodocyclaceae bacterium]
MPDSMLQSILVIDDEPAVVAAVQRELYARPFGYFEYDVEGFVDPLQALARAAEKPFDAVICDLRMPGMDGMEVLEALAVLQPDCARIVLSGAADMQALRRMANASHVYRFIPKPWTSAHLRAVLAEALEYRGILLERRRLIALAEAGAAHLAWVEPEAVDQVLVVHGPDGELQRRAAAALAGLAEYGMTAVLYGELTQDIGHGAAPLAVSVRLAATMAEAQHLLEENHFSCAIADDRLADGTGIAMLSHVAERQRECGRILVSRDLDRDELIGAINEAHVVSVIEAPWSDDQLRLPVLQAIFFRRTLRTNIALSQAAPDLAGKPAP